MNNGPLLRSPCSNPKEPLNVTLYGKRDFADVIELGIWRWKDNLGLSRWAPKYNDQSPHKKGTERGAMTGKGGVMYFESGGSQGGLEAEPGEERSSPQSLRKHPVSLPTA